VTDQFLGEIRPVSFNFAPVGWALCNGQILPISQNTALFSLLGTTYGGNGTSNFALPNLQALFPMHFGQSPGLSPYELGQTGGENAVTLLTQQLPTHSHAPQGAPTAGSADSPAGAVWAQPRFGRATDQVYATSATPGALAPMAPQTLLADGGGQPHNNLPPYLVINFVIAMTGIFPARS
jgi:microcystin-dependent protein